MKPIFLTLTLVMFMAGCASFDFAQDKPASSSPAPDPATPNIMPRLDPSPTPSDSTLPLTCQVTDLNVHVNEADGYCFAYPSRFAEGTQPMLDLPAIVGPTIGDGIDPVFASFAVQITPATDESLRAQAEAFLKEFSTADPASFSWTQVPVGGEAGWMVEPVPVMLSWRIVFVQHNGSLFRLMYWPVDIPEAQADLDELTQTTLGSFAFLK
jgi:hypothetical protein